MRTSKRAFTISKKSLLYISIGALLLSIFTVTPAAPVRAATITSGTCTASVDTTSGVFIFESGGYCYIAFKNTATSYSWTVPSAVTGIDLLAVGGGGGGASRAGGGGGGGEFIEVNGVSVTAGNSLSISVGAGGTGGLSTGSGGTPGTDGSASSLSGTNGTTSYTARGGLTGSNAGGNYVGGTYFGGTGGQFANACSGTTSTGWCTGGGAGASASGENPDIGNNNRAGNGGAGRTTTLYNSSVATGLGAAPTAFSGGGGGGISGGGTATAGAATFGGGAGSAGKTSPVAGASNTGGGGGGSGYENSTGEMTGGAGGSGVVVIKFALTVVGSGNCTQRYSTIGAGTVTVTEANGYCFIAFRNTGAVESQTSFTLAKPTSTDSIEYLVVAGGGGGGLRHTGGGGAGGLLKGTLSISSLSTLSLTVGGGGAGRVRVAPGPESGPGATGKDSILETVVAKGGGGGNTGIGAGGDGGSGGGARQISGGQPTSGQGNAGGGSDGNTTNYAAGGGGGAGSAGSAGSSVGGGGAGGSGAIWVSSFTKSIAEALGWPSTSTQYSGDQVFFAGGGGGGSANSGGGSASAGGGAGSGTSNGVAGLANSGGGGGGSGCCLDSPGGNGGSGVIIVSYAPSPYTVTYSYNDATAGNGTSSDIFSVGGTALTLPVPTRTGYTFGGWFVNSGFSGSALGATYTPTQSQTIYAKWTGNKYSYNANTGSNAPADQTFAGSTITAASGASLTAPNGYSFGGWCTTQPSVGAACGGTTYAVGASLPTPSSATVTLYAIWRGQQIDYALNLSGTVGQYGQISSGQIIPATGAFTVQVWFKPAADVPINSFPMLFSQGTGANQFYLKRSTAGELIYYRDGGGAEANCGTTPANAWSHAAITFSSGTLTCFLNGVQRSTLSANSSISTRFVVGEYSESLNQQVHTWKGSIDEVRVYNTGRSAIQIRADAHAYATVSDATLVAYYDFNEGTGSTAVNQKVGAAANTNLTLSGSPTWSDVAETANVNGRSVVTFKRSYLNNLGGWTPPADVTAANALVVGGGGGGGAWVGGGGGGGGFRNISSVSVTPGTAVAVTVGAGGEPAVVVSMAYNNLIGTNGSESKFGTILAAGGGKGGSHRPTGTDTVLKPNAGGSGGGGTGSSGQSGYETLRVGATGNTPSTSPVQGFDGGSGSPTSGSYVAGGGGGAGGAGSNGSSTAGGAGGPGASSNITGSTVFYAGGGGGIVYNSFTGAGAGGSGGGGAGTANGTGVDGAANTGGGGGGGGSTTSYTSRGGSGGSGIVIVSYGLENQTALTVSSTTATFGSNLALTTSGGSGSGTVSYAVTSAGTAGCSVSGSTLSFTSVGTCTVTATKASADGYSAVSSSATTITVNAATATVTFKSNYTGGASDTTQTVQLSTATALTSNAFTRNGYTFAGWTQNSNGTGTNYTDGESVTLVSGLTLHAKWTFSATPIISFNASDINSYESTGTSVTGLNGSTVNATASGGITYDSTNYAWNFSGGTNAAGPFIDVSDVSSTNLTSGITFDFEANFGSVQDNFERIIDFGEGGIENDNIIVSRVGTSSDLMAEIWRGNVPSRCTFGSAISENVMMRYTIVLDGSTCRLFRNGSAIEFGTFAYTTQPVSGLTLSSSFIGKSNWSPYAQYEGKIRSLRVFSGAFTSSDLAGFTYRAVTFSANNGSPTPATAITSGAIRLPAAISRSGYTFQGWYDGTDYATATLVGVASASYSPAVVSTLYSGWAGNKYFYNANTGSNPPADQTFAGTTLTAASGSSVTAPVGYAFGGWCTTQPSVGASCGGTSYAAGANLPNPSSATVTLFATWNGNSNTVTYDAKGGTSVANGSFTTGGSIASAPTPPTLAGYTLAGWSATDGGSVISFPYSPGVTSDITLYAKWTANTYTVTYSYNDATAGNGTSSAIFTVGESALVLPTPTKTGLLFAGWYSDLATTTLVGRGGASYSPSAAGMLYAKWTNLLINLDAFDTASHPGTGSTWTSVLPGTAIDKGTMAGNVAFSNLGGIKSLTFDGSGDLVHFSDATARITGPMTFETWINPSSLSNPDFNVIATRWYSGMGSAAAVTRDFFFALRKDGTKVKLNLHTANLSNQWGSHDFAVSGINKWYHVAFTIDANNMGQMYVNGQPDGASFYVLRTMSTDALFILGNSKTDWGFTGKISKVRVFNTNLSAASVLSSYDSDAATFSISSTVTFKSNYTGGALDSTQSVSLSTATALTSNSFTRTGYTFAGWTANSDGTGTSYTDSQSVTLTGSLTLYAKWTANSNTVTFNSNYGTPTTITQSITTDAATALTSNTFTRTGYTFAGWTANSDGTSTSYTDSQSVTLTGSLTLYAKWTANTNTVTYNSKGGTSVSNGSFTTGGSIASAPTSPTLAGYTLDGWSATDGGSVVSFPYSPGATAAITFYAKWTANTNTVTYNSKGGTSVSNGSFTTGGSIASAPTPPTLTGYIFAGWTATDGGSTVITFPYSPGATAAITLYAKWTANTNTVTYNSKGGTSVSNGSFTTGGSIASAPTPPTLAGYTLDGWSATDGGSVVSFPYSPSATAAITLYAKWTEITYLITYAKSGATGNSERATDTYSYTGGGVTLSTVGTMTKAGFSFDGWQVTGTTTKLTSPYIPSANVQLDARWSAASYAITYFSNSGGTAPSAGTYTTGGAALTLPTQGSMSRTGYTFNGWSTTVNDVSTKVGTATISPSAPVNLYALWTAVPYSVTYSSESSTGGSVPSDAINYNIGNNAVVKANSGALVRTGYSFAGWTLTSGGSGTAYQSGETYTVGSANLIFYPKWSANTYVFTYNVNGATGTPARESDTYTTAGSTISLPNVGTMAKTGYNFAGWSTSSTGSVHSGAFTTSSDVTLFAIWTIKTINYYYDRGTAGTTVLSNLDTTTFPDTAAQSAQFNSSITLSSSVDPTITVGSDNYKFYGWYDGNATYGTGSSFVMPDATKTFTAQWVKLYGVRYALNGGTGILARDIECEQTGYTCLPNQQITLSSAPTRLGYTFTGWKDQANAPFAADSLFTVTGTSYLLYAQWTAIDYTMSFASNGGSTSNPNQIKNIDQSFTFPSPGVRAGYVFNGWIRSDIVNSPIYGTGTSFVTGSIGINFEASWTPLVYNVSYNWNGGVGTPTPPVNFTVGTTAITLPIITDQARDGYVFDGWQVSGTTTKLTSPYSPTATALLEARWADGAYTITYNNFNGSSNTTASVTRETSVTLPTPTRTGFSFDGWYKDAEYTLRYSAGGVGVIPTASQTLIAKWVQNSLVGIDPAHLNSLVDLTKVANSVSNWTGSHTLSGTAAELTVPANALPAGTKIKVSFVEDLTRPANLIDSNNAYFTSVVVHWLTGTGSSATVPDAVSGSPLTLTLSNPAIVAGAKVFKIVNGVSTEVSTATVDGEVTITFTQDPEFVVAATRAGSPTAVTATNGQNAQSTVSWNAPLGNGGSSVTGYTVTASPGSATCATTGTSCQVSGLTNNTAYTFTVTATNAIGTSASSSPSSAITPRLALTYNVGFNSNGGSPVANSSFVEDTSFTAPTDPTRSGYNFIGWATIDGDESTIVSFPYSPPINADLTLYAIWRASNPALNPDNSGNSGAVITPVSTNASAKPKATPSAKPNVTSSPAPTPAPTGALTPSEIFANAPKPEKGIDVPQAGAANAIVGDRAVETVITVTEFAKTIEIGDAISISFQAADAAGNVLPTSISGSIEVLLGATITANGSGFKPGSPVEAWLYSDPVLLGSGVATADGTFDNTYAIDSQIPLGDHTVLLHGLSLADEVVSLALGITVVSADEQAATANLSAILLASLALLFALLLFGLWRVNRRRNGAHQK